MKIKLGKAVNRLLSLFGLRVYRVDKRFSSKHAKGYLRAPEMIAKAKKEGLSVADYVERLRGRGQVGESARVIMRMKQAGAIGKDNIRICEIGAGTGTYLEKILKEVRPEKYEVYETDKEWAAWLADTYPVVCYPADGVSLSYTHDSSVGLVHAHGVFVYLPFLVTYRYFVEIARVASPGAYVVFDIFSEQCLTNGDVEAWLQSDEDYLFFLSASYVDAFFRERGFVLVSSWLKPYGPARSHYLIYRRS